MLGRSCDRHLFASQERARAPHQGRRLLELIAAEEAERAALTEDARGGDNVPAYLSGGSGWSARIRAPPAPSAASISRS